MREIPERVVERPKKQPCRASARARKRLFMWLAGLAGLAALLLSCARPAAGSRTS